MDAGAGREIAVEDPLVRDAKAYAGERLSEGVTVADMARSVHVSVPQLNRRFRKAMGVSPGKWLVAQRLISAADLLRYSELSVTEIAHEVGYKDTPTFSKAFRRWKGISPSEYRVRR